MRGMNADRVEQTLAEVLANWQHRVAQRLALDLPESPFAPATLTQSMTYSLLAGGKRLRPILALLACEACGGDPTDALPAASAIEMVHTYSLIHDDLPAMDDDDLRRGRPTNHIVYGEAMAILAGDGLLTRAFELLARDLRPAAVAAACVVDLANAAGYEGMVAGQVADLEAEHQPVKDLAVLEAIHHRKTGRLLSCALTMGARIGGASEELIQSFAAYGKCVGLAFQITDDLLDVLGDAEKMGKGVRKDTHAGKLTYPALLGVAESQKRADQLVADACEHLSTLGERGRLLADLAHSLCRRDH